MRNRIIKEGFFRNYDLAQLPPLARILFEGLWCMADKEGVVAETPARIKADCLPYDSCDIWGLLVALEEHGLIRPHEPKGVQLILSAIDDFFLITDSHYHYEQRTLRLSDARLKGTHTQKEWFDLVEEFGARCLCCLEKKSLAKDHIIPIRWGGSDAIDNLQPLCKECNSRKHATVFNWVEIRRREGIEP